VLSALNRRLDRVVRPWLPWRGRRLSIFKICGYTGLMLAVLLSMILVAGRGLPLWVMVVIILSAVLTFYGLAMVTKIIIREERLIYYHHEIAVILVAASVLAILGQPILPYLDATILGIGIFLVCGRVGCFMVGCCHGKPAGWGVCYRQEHARAGFDSYLVGVRLLPIQLIESLWVFMIVVAGSVMVFVSQPPGSALAFYVVSYDLGRFTFEFVRGDHTRPYFAGFSEAQWISVGLVLVVVGAEWAGVLPYQGWHVMVAVLMLVLIFGVALWRTFRRSDEHLLLGPRHIRELAGAIDSLSASAGTLESPIPIKRTSHGLQLSLSQPSPTDSLATPNPLTCYTISRPQRPLTPQVAISLLTLITRLRHRDLPADIIPGDHSVYHLCIHPRHT
jgi:hypothetical protein